MARPVGRPRKVEKPQRRTRGTGSVVVTGQRAYALDVRDAAGHRETYEGVGPTLADRRADAERWLDGQVAARARAAGLAPETVGQFLARWLAETHRGGTAGTYRTHRARLRWAAELRPIRVADLTPDDINRVTDAMLAAGRSHRYCRAVRTTLRTAFAQLVPQILSANPVGPYRRALPIPRSRPKAWDEPPALAFLAVARTSRWGPLWTIALAYGLRHHELRGLQWSDLNERTGELTIHNQKTHRDRTLTLVRPILDQLLAWRTANPEHTSASWMFVARPGRRMAKPTLSAEFAELAAGLPPLTVHGLRHTCATLLLRKGVPVAKVAELLGHHSPAFTYAMYGWAVPSDQAVVDRAVEGFFEGF